MVDFPSNPYVGQVYTWQNSQYMWDGLQWINLTAPHSAIAPVFVSASAPEQPVKEGTFWFNTLTQVLNIWVVEPGGPLWKSVTEQPPENLCVFVSVSPPENPIQGNLWYNPHTHLFQVWVFNGLTYQWDVISDCEPDVDAPPVIVSVSPPDNPVQGTLWYRPSNSTLYLWIDSLTGGGWASITSSNPTSKPTVYISASVPTNPSQGDLWLDPRFKILKAWNVTPTGGAWIDTFPCDLLGAAASAAESAEQAAASADLAKYWAEQAQAPLGEVRIDSSQTGIIYVGKAPAGSLENSPVWSIKKSLFSSSGVFTSEQTFENVSWTDRYLLPL